MSTYSSFLSNIFMAAYIETQSLSIDDVFPYGTEVNQTDMVDFFKFTEGKLTSPYFSTGYEIYSRNI